MAGSLKSFRRTAIAAGVVGLAVIATAVTGPIESAGAGTPATTATAGQASAIAQSYKVDPRTAALSLGISFGVSLAGYTNNVAQAESRGIDLGIIGSTLAAEGCDGGDPTLPAENQPIPLHADSRDKDASQTKTDQEKYVPLISKTARADSTPFAEATTTTGSLTGSGLVNIDGVLSRATTRLNDGNREAVAYSEVGSFGIGGIIELAGLKWNARSTTGKDDKNDGSFEVGALKVLGQTLPLGATGGVKGAIDTANTLLKPLGIVVSWPQVHIEAGILFVDPLRISIVPSAQRDLLLNTVLSAIPRKDLYDFLLEQDCGNKTYILVSDIAIGSVTGAGSLSLELGGVQTKSEVLKTSNFLGGNLSGAASSIDNSFDAGSLGSINDLPAFEDVPATSGSTGTGSKGNTNGTRRTALAASTKGSRGGKMAMVGGLGLLALLIVADRDRRLMRRAQRAIPTEA